ncbi:hypothetical protein BT93_C0935 [Corymbia citriodora subsp. variegata]|nr:hypothetical protein BT93_C0935 [Corymbia citriodora subsp. variegata]
MLFHHKLRSSSSSPSLLFCCFHDGHAAAAYHEAASSDCNDGGNTRKFRLAGQDRCRSLIARIGRCWLRPGHAAAAASSEFGYDPMSYALNFEDDRSRESDEEFPAREFPADCRCLRIGCRRGKVVACS